MPQIWRLQRHWWMVYSVAWWCESFPSYLRCQSSERIRFNLNCLGNYISEWDSCFTSFATLTIVKIRFLVTKDRNERSRNSSSEKDSAERMKIIIIHLMASIIKEGSAETRKYFSCRSYAYAVISNLLIVGEDRYSHCCYRNGLFLHAKRRM